MPEIRPGKRAKAAACAEFEFTLTVVDRGNAHCGGPVVDVQIDSHHPKFGTANLMVGQDLRPDVAEALACVFARPFTSAVA